MDPEYINAGSVFFHFLVPEFRELKYMRIQRHGFFNLTIYPSPFV